MGLFYPEAVGTEEGPGGDVQMVGGGRWHNDVPFSRDVKN